MKVAANKKATEVIMDELTVSRNVAARLIIMIREEAHTSRPGMRTHERKGVPDR